MYAREKENGKSERDYRDSNGEFESWLIVREENKYY